MSSSCCSNASFPIGSALSLVTGPYTLPFLEASITRCSLVHFYMRCMFIKEKIYALTCACHMKFSRLSPWWCQAKRRQVIKGSNSGMILQNCLFWLHCLKGTMLCNELCSCTWLLLRMNPSKLQSPANPHSDGCSTHFLSQQQAAHMKLNPVRP